MHESERTDEVCPDVLGLLCERERPATTTNTSQHLPNMRLCERQERPAKGFCRAIGQGLGERSATEKVCKGKLLRSGLLGVKSRIERQGRGKTGDDLLKV